MPYPVPPPPPLVQVADLSYADTSIWSDAESSPKAESQVLLPEPMSPLSLLVEAPAADGNAMTALTQPVSQPPSAPLLADAGAADSSLGSAMEVGLPSGGSLPGSHFGDLHQDYDLDETKARSMESEARSRLGDDDAAYEETARLFHESRNMLGELVDWVTQQPEFQNPPPEDASQEDFQAPLPTLPDPAAPQLTPQPADPASPETDAIPLGDLDLNDPNEAAGGVDALEVVADRQIYDQRQQVFTAEGNVILTVRGAVLTADEVRVNLPNQVAIATGNVIFTRGEQVLRGDQIEYNFVREQGAILDARGEVFIPQIASDLSADAPVEDPSTAAPNSSIDGDELESDVLSQRLSRQQPPVETATAVGGVVIGAGLSQRGAGGQGQSGGSVRQLRFEAERVDFRPGGWVATNVRLTNDPFSPPELEIRTNRATFQRLSATRSELRLENPRLVIDQGFTLPLLRSRFIFDQRQRSPLPIQFGFDEDDRDGLFAERSFEVIATPTAQFTVTPQFYIQRALTGRDEDDIEPGEDDTGVFNPNSYGLTSDLDVDFDQSTSLEAELVMTSLDFDGNFADEDLRGQVRLRRLFGNGYTVTGEYSYRDRLFNGTLGFQTVDQSYGVIVTSPVIELGDSGVQLTYQGAIQRITDDIVFERRDDILGPFDQRDDNVTTLTRYQAAAELRRFFPIWAGRPLPATPDQGLRYTPNPVVPFVGFNPRLRGVAGFYSSGDTQPILTANLSFIGQFGHFSRPAFDYLGFNITYRRSTEGSESPFNFDRVPDREVLSGGLTAQLFGPIRVGFQTSISLDEDEDFDTSYFVEYSRRTFGVLLRFNPDREVGSLNLRISDFTWSGTPRRFDAEPVDYDPELVSPELVPSESAGPNPVELDVDPQSVQVEPEPESTGP